MDISGLSSAYSDLATSAAKTQNAEILKDKIKNTDTNNDDDLMKVCKEFEAYFTEQVYKEMMKTVPKHEGEQTSALVDYFKDITISEIANQSVEENNGVGLAQTLYEQMRRNYE